MNERLYTYRNIKYTYADLQAARRRQQAEFGKAVDCGNYAAACYICDRDAREYLPQMTAPERSGTTGHNQTSTAPRKSGILETIKRVLRIE